MPLKYVIIKVSGYELPIWFPDALVHRDMIDPKKCAVVAAGFCALSVENGKAAFRAWGKSRALGQESRPQDAALLTEVLHEH